VAAVPGAARAPPRAAAVLVAAAMETAVPEVAARARAATETRTAVAAVAAKRD
jgi:hypothetical protein